VIVEGAVEVLGDASLATAAVGVLATCTIAASKRVRRHRVNQCAKKYAACANNGGLNISVDVLIAFPIPERGSKRPTRRVTRRLQLANSLPHRLLACDSRRLDRGKRPATAEEARARDRRARGPSTNGAGERAVVSSMPMNAVKARVQNGRIVVDEPTDLPDGEIYLVPVNDADQLDEHERAALDASIADGLADAREGRHEDARAVLADLRSRT
jgi:hypothetical protein